jgi:hypothetical protein
MPDAAPMDAAGDPKGMAVPADAATKGATLDSGKIP